MNSSIEQALLQEFTRAQEGAVLEVADQGLATLAQLVDGGSIDVSPKFQRRDRWTTEAQSLLIESFLTNIPVPPVYLAEDSARIGSYAVIDGKQRLTTISTFFSDRLILRGLTRLPLLNGYTYETLPIGIRNSIGMKSLRVTTLLRQSTEDLKHEVFIRLNTGGEVLNPQELRNVAYRGPLNELIYRLSEDSFLREQFKVVPPSSPAFRQMTDAELVLRFLTLEGSGWRNFKGDLRDEMDRFMYENRFASDEELARKEAAFKAAIDLCESVWGSDAFKRPGRDQALTGLYDAQMLSASELTKPQRTKIQKNPQKAQSLTAALFEIEEYEEAVRRATNTPSRLRSRTDMTITALRQSVTP